MIKGPGLALSERFFQTLIAPVLAEHFPALPHATT